MCHAHTFRAGSRYSYHTNALVAFPCEMEGAEGSAPADIDAREAAGRGRGRVCPVTAMALGSTLGASDLLHNRKGECVTHSPFPAEDERRKLLSPKHRPQLHVPSMFHSEFLLVLVCRATSTEGMAVSPAAPPGFSTPHR